MINREVGRQIKVQCGKTSNRSQRRSLDFIDTSENNIWYIVLKNEPSKICGRQPLKNLK